MKTIKDIYIGKDTIESNLILKKIKSIVIVKDQKIIIDEGYYVICKINEKIYKELEDGIHKFNNDYVGEQMELIVLNLNLIDYKFNTKEENSDNPLEGELSFFINEPEEIMKSKLLNYDEVWCDISKERENKIQNKNIKYKDLKELFKVIIKKEQDLESIGFKVREELENYNLYFLSLTLYEKISKN